MLEPIIGVSVKAALGTNGLPANVTVIGSGAVRDTKTGVCGVLIRHNATGRYSLISRGSKRRVDPLEAMRFENGIARVLR